MLLVGGALVPAALHLPNRLWWRFTAALGWLNARVLLTLFFFLVITPVGVVLKLLRRNPLQPPPGDTNWRPYPDRYRDSNHYERMF